MSLVNSTTSATGALAIVHVDDADAADFKLAPDRFGGLGNQPVPFLADDRPIIADQGESAVEQAQRQVGFSGS